MAELTVPSLDFSTLGNLGNIYREAQDANNVRQTLASLGQGGKVDPTTLLRSGNLSLAQLGLQLQQRETESARQARLDERQLSRDATSDRQWAASYGLQKRAADRSDEGPVEKAGERARAAGNYGIQPGTPEFKRYVLTGALPEDNTTVQNQVEQRKQAAQGLGLTPEHPAYQSFILTGKMPREDAQPLTATDKKAILEADEGVLAAKTAITSLDRALKLSEQAFAGPKASTRGYLASFLGPDSDMGKAGIATTQLDNEVTSNALSQLKAIFGGAPTEGERKILLDIQGASSQPHEVRKEIFARARSAAEARLKFNEQRAAEMRGGQFYKPQGSMTRAPVVQTQGITQAQYEALPSGSPFTAPDGSQRVKP